MRRYRGRDSHRYNTLERKKILSRNKDHVTTASKSQYDNQKSFEIDYQTENVDTVNYVTTDHAADIQAAHSTAINVLESAHEKQEFDVVMDEHHLLQQVKKMKLKTEIKNYGDHVTKFRIYLENTEKNINEQIKSDTYDEELGGKLIKRSSQYMNDILCNKTSSSNESDIMCCSHHCEGTTNSSYYNEEVSLECEDDDSDQCSTIHNEEPQIDNDELYGQDLLCKGREKQEIYLMKARIGAQSEEPNEDFYSTQLNSDNLCGDSSGWDANDMFYRNKELGVTSSYSPDMEGYTTPLLRKDSPEYRAKEKKAERIAKEISSSSKSRCYEDAENRDEECNMREIEEYRAKEKEAERIEKENYSSSQFLHYYAGTRDEELIMYADEQKTFDKLSDSCNLNEKDKSDISSVQKTKNTTKNVEENFASPICKSVLNNQTVPRNSSCGNINIPKNIQLYSSNEEEINEKFSLSSLEHRNLQSRIKPALDKTSRIIANRKKAATVSSVNQQRLTQAHVLSQDAGNIRFVRSHNKQEYKMSKSNQMQDKDVMEKVYDIGGLNNSMSSLTASSLSLNSSMYNVLSSIKPANINALCLEENVEVTHVVSPSLFYISRETDAYQKRKLETIIKHLALEAEQVIKPQIDKVYLGQYTVDNRWYRAVVKGIKKDECQVQYVDYGNFEIINKVRIRECPENFNLEVLPRFSKSCGLWEIIPASGSIWDSEAITTFSELVEEINLQLFVINIPDGQQEPEYEIELRRPVTTPGIANTFPAPIREVLVFLELAVYINDSPENTFDQIVKLRKKSYFKQEVPLGDENCDVELGHCESPGCIYLHLKRFSEDRQKLNQKIQSHYNSAKVRAGKDWNMLVPKVGYPCIARYSGDEKWYRALITDIPGNKMVDVFYIDLGNIERLWHKQIKRIHEDFLRLPAQSIKCHIYDVLPISDDKWDKNLHQESLAYFLMLVEGQDLVANFHSIENYPESLSSESYLALSEYESHSVSITAVSKEGNSIIDVAELLIDGGCARAQKTKMYSSISSIDTNCNDIYLPRKKSLRQAIEFYDPLSNIISFPVSDIPVNKIRRVKYVDMTGNYIHLLYKNHLNKIQDIQARLEIEMQRFPTNEPYTPKEGDVCVLIGDHKPYYARVRILKIKDDKAQVYLLDCGGIRETSSSSLVPIPTKFLEEKSLAIMASLTDLIPPGGSEKWPLATLDMIKNLIKSYDRNLYIVRKEAAYPNPMNDIPILPVELGWEMEEPGGPFTPSDIKLISLNQLLVQEGYALRAKFNNQERVRKEDQRDMDIESFTQSTITLTNDFDSSSDSSLNDSDYSPDLAERQDPIGDTNALSYMVNQTDDCIKQWLPAVLPQTSVFTAIPSNVDMNAKIYINLLTDMENLDKMNTNQKWQYQESKPTNADLCYEPGDLVVAKYPYDNSWCRATVLSKDIEQGKFEVVFVDYGNQLTVNVGDMRKSIFHKNQPILSHCCILDGIVPINLDGRWNTDILDQLHSRIVEKECRVTIVRPPILGEDLYIKLQVINCKETDISYWLVDAMKVCKRVFNASHCYKEIQDSHKTLDEDSTDVIIEESSQSLSSFEESKLKLNQHHQDEELLKLYEVDIHMPLPEMGLPFNYYFPAEIISIENEDQMFIRPKLNSLDQFFKLKKIKESKERFDRDFPNAHPLMRSTITHPEVGKIYLGAHEYGMKHFHRVQVLENKNKNVEVLFVDEGIKKAIPKKSLRMCIPEDLKHPQQCAKVSLYMENKKVRYIWSKDAIQTIGPNNILSNFWAYVKGRDFGRNHEVQLVSHNYSWQEKYDELVNNGYLLKSKKQKR